MTTKRLKYRFYPNKTQSKILDQSFGSARFIFNWGLSLSFDILEERKLQQKQGVPKKDQISLNLSALSSAFASLKKQDEFSWLNDISSVVLQQSLKNVISSWSRCFKKQNKQPKFKAKHYSKKSLTYTKSGFRIKDGKVYLAKMKHPLKIKWSRDLSSDPSSCTVTKDAIGRYFISFVVDQDVELLERIDKTIGVDLGISNYLITSDGDKIDNPKFYEKNLKKLKKAQQKLSRKVKGSKNREKQKLKVAKIHAKIKDKRHDFLHKLSTTLIHENQGIGVESLAVKKMVEDRRYALRISDASWSTFVSMLEYKAKERGRKLIKIDQFFPSSKLCSSCGYKNETLKISDRSWVCPKCSSEHDRDVNAAVNIRVAAGLAETLNACGDGLRHL